nr:S8 family serine peptidase [uncultured Pseudomonas sp.]
MRLVALLLGALAGSSLLAAAEPGTAPTAPGAAPPRTTVVVDTPVTREPTRPAAEPAAEPGLPQSTPPVVPEATRTAAPGTPPQTIARPAGKGPERPNLQAAPEQWRGVQPPPLEELPVLREWLVLSRNLDQAQEQRRALQAFKLTIVRRQQLTHMGGVISVYRIPAELDLPQLEQQLRRQFPDWQQELNLRYRPLSAPLAPPSESLRNWGQRAMGRAQPASQQCGGGLVLAMLDGPVNTQLAEFIDADLHYLSLLPAQFSPRADGAARHGSSVAALLLGRAQVNGLLPGASLHALGVFGEDAEAGLHTRSDWVIQALDQVAGIQPPVRVVNLSFGGSYSLLLQRTFEQLASRMAFVAAAGNDGVARIRYPAAYASVIAVGAVDARLRRVRQSNYGAELALVAPGEDIWTLDENGQGYFASGTSFAAPFVSAALALAASSNALRAQARDLGEPGPDPAYGNGLARLAECR